MARRTKKEMQQMESDVRYYLMYNRYDAHKSYDAYIKDRLLSGQPMLYYINGIKDFIKLASIMQAENQAREKQKIIDVEQQEQKNNMIEKIICIPYKKFIEAYKQAKEQGIEKHKMAFCDMATLQYHNELKGKDITNYYIYVCKQYKLI